MVSSVKLAELWQHMGYRVVAVCMGPTTGRETVSPSLTIVRVKDLFFPDPLNYGIAPTFLPHVLRALREEKPDLIVVNKVLFWSSLVVPFLRLLGHRSVVTTDALVGMTWRPRGFLPKLLMAFGAWTVGWIVLLCASRIVFFHPQPARLLAFLGISRKSKVIPTGIAIEKYKERPAERVEVHRNSIIITYIGRLESVKGVDDFLTAAIPLKREFPTLAIQVVGWYRKHHPLVGKFRHDVIFTGLREDIPAVLQATDIFVLPSYSEGLSNALMEAMVSGCACVATNVGGNAFLIEDGISGLLFPPGDRTALQRHLRRLLGETALRQRLGVAAHKRVMELCDWSVVEGKYATLFAEMHG